MVNVTITPASGSAAFDGSVGSAPTPSADTIGYIWASGTKNVGLYYTDGTGTTTSMIDAGGGGGDVTKVGTPVDNQLGVWTGDGTIEGNTNLTFTNDNKLYIVPTNAEAHLQLGAGNVVLQYSGSKGRLYSANRTLRMGNTGAEIKMLNGTDDSIHFFTNGTSDSGTERMTILSGGNVGIGTTAPSNTLEVAGVIRGTNYIWQKQDGTPGVLFGAGGDADIYYDGTDMNINPRRVGSGDINVTAGDLILNGDSTAFSIKDADGTETVRLATASSDQGLLYLRGATGGNAIYLDGNGSSYFNGGNVGIGTTGPDAAAELTIVGRVYQDVGSAGAGNVNYGSGSFAHTSGIGNYGGSYSTALGFQSMALLSGNAHGNTAVGYRSMYGDSTGIEGTYNTAMGYQAMLDIKDGYSNVAIGTNAGKTLVDGYYNVYLGVNAGDGAVTSAHSNVGIGISALSSAHGAGNVAIGRGALSSTLDANQVAIGYSALEANTSGEKNTAVGYQALTANTTGNYNVAMGHEALESNVHGDGSVALGYEALATSAPADNIGYNVGIGFQALTASTTAHSNIAIGRQALDSVTAGSENVAIGTYAGQAYVGGAGTTGGFGVFIGHTAGYLVTGNGSYKSITLVGHAAGYSATGAQSSTGIGASALYYADGAEYVTAVGRTAGAFAEGTGSTLIGDSAGYRISGNYNVAIGYEALSGASSGTGYGTAQKNVAIGRQALKGVTSAHSNVAIGYQAMEDATEAAETVAIGIYAGADITTGKWNTILGYSALRSGTTANRHTALGYAAMQNYTQTGDGYNVAVGMYAMNQVETGSSNVAIGYTALRGATGHDMDYNVAIGAQAMYSNTTGDNNTAIGRNSLFTNTTGEGNTVIGAEAGETLSTGDHNVMVGFAAGEDHTGQYSVFIGKGAGTNNTSADGNVMIGNNAGQANTTQTQNTYVGFQAGYASAGNENTMIGYNAGVNTTAGHNVVIGSAAGSDMTTGDYNVLMGVSAGANITGSQQNVLLGAYAGRMLQASKRLIAIGYEAAYMAPTGYQVAIGHTALHSPTTATENLAIGYAAINGGSASTSEYNTALGNYTLNQVTDSAKNVAVGYKAGYAITTGDDNIIIGYQAGLASTTASSNIIVGTNALDSNNGNNNVIIGTSAAQGATTMDSSTIVGHQAAGGDVPTGDYNTSIGYQTLYQLGAGAESNTALGHRAGYTHTTGDDSTYIGTNAGSGSTTAHSNTVVGKDALRGTQDSSTGGQNAIIGVEAAKVTTGMRNVMLGFRAGYTATSAQQNVYVGYEAGQKFTTGDNNVALGPKAGPSSTSTDSNKLYIHNDSGTPLIGGDFASDYVDINGNLNTHNIRPLTDDTYTLGTASLKWSELHMSDKIILDGHIYLADSTGQAGTNQLYASGASLYWNTSKLNDQSSTAVVTGTNWTGGSGGVFPITFVEDEAGRLLNTVSAATLAYFNYDVSNAKMTVRNADISSDLTVSTNFILGGVTTTDIKKSTDSASTSDADLVTAGYVNAHGGGSPGGSDTQIQFNDGGSFGGDAGLTYVKGTDTLTAGAYNLENLDDQLTWAGRTDLLIQGTASYDMELISPQDMAFAIDSDNNETAHKFMFNTNTKTPSSAGTNLMTILETGKVGIGTAAPDYKLDVRQSGHSVALISGSGNGSSPVCHIIDSNDQQALLVEGTDATDDKGVGVYIYHNDASPSTSNRTFLNFQMNDSAGNKTNYAQIRGGIDVNTNGSEGGNLQFYVQKAGSITEVARFQDEGRLGIGTTAPNVALHVNGDGRFEENHKLYFADSATNTFIRGASSDLELHSGDDIYINATDDIRIASDQVTFADDADNVHLTIMETGTNSALISGASSAGLYLTTDSGTRIELTGNKIIQTGRVTSSMTSANEGAVNTATDGGSFYEVEAIANEGIPGATLTTTLTLPDGAVGGERYTISCTAAGSLKPPLPGTTLTGTCIISGTLVNGTAGVAATSMTGATAAGLGNVQQALYEFIWVPGTVGGMGGWMYTSKVYT